MGFDQHYRSRELHPEHVPGAQNNGNGTYTICSDLLSNQPPIVNLTSPTNGATYNQGPDISLTATASDSDGIAKVTFYDGTAVLGEDILTPYTYVWQNASVGSHDIKAVAEDNQGST